MTEEEKFEQLKAATIKKYKDYIIETEKMPINDLHVVRHATFGSLLQTA